MDKSTYGQALARYRDLRREVQQFVERESQELYEQGLRLTDITKEALDAADKWRNDYAGSQLTRRPGWDWEKTNARFSKRARKIEAALWFQDSLQGLAVGHISRGRLVATIHYMESRPVANPLKGTVAVIMTRFLELMATRLGCKMTSLENPVEALVDYYAKELGYIQRVEKHNRVLRLQKPVSLS